MTTYSITDPIVDPIGIVGTTAQLFENTSNIYDVAIGGQPFLLAASDRYPYQRQTATYRKQYWLWNLFSLSFSKSHAITLLTLQR